jgi:hypothetical protein
MLGPVVLAVVAAGLDRVRVPLNSGVDARCRKV